MLGCQFRNRLQFDQYQIVNKQVCKEFPNNNTVKHYFNGVLLDHPMAVLAQQMSIGVLVDLFNKTNTKCIANLERIADNFFG